MEQCSHESYTCQICKGIYGRALTESEARAQYEKEFPMDAWETEVPDPENQMVCDDCWKNLRRAGLIPNWG